MNEAAFAWTSGSGPRFFKTRALAAEEADRGRVT